MTTATYTPKPIFDNTTEIRQKALECVNANKNDYRHACDFLYSYRGSEATFNAYRREIERLLHWTWNFKKTSLTNLRHTDIESYIEFCKNPPSSWIGTKNVNRFIASNGQRIANPQWRPFVATVSKRAHRDGVEPDIKSYSLSQKALQAIFSILSSFFNFLIQEQYTNINPVSQIRQKSKFIRKQQNKAQIRRLSELQWAYVIETAEDMASKDPEQHERTLFIMNALFAMYLRISELASSDRWQPQMGHFFRDNDNLWWFKTVGKGNKERDISVSDSMLTALKRYRLSLGLSSLPFPGETTPLIVKTRGKGEIKGTRQIRRIVQTCFDKAIDRIKSDGFHEEADQMISATVHWLRHTGISEDVKTRPREHVRDDAGHGSSAITDRYIDIELRARHASAKKKKIRPDELD